LKIFLRLNKILLTNVNKILTPNSSCSSCFCLD